MTLTLQDVAEIVRRSKVLWRMRLNASLSEKLFQTRIGNISRWSFMRYVTFLFVPLDVQLSSGNHNLKPITRMS